MENIQDIEKDLKRERFGLERYQAQVTRWKQELIDLDNTGFLAFLVDVAGKKSEAEQKLLEAQQDMKTAQSRIEELEKKAGVVRAELVDSADEERAGNPEISEDATDEIDEALEIIGKMKKATEVSREALNSAVSGLSSARPTFGRSKRAHATGVNVEMALEVLRERSSELCNLLNPLITDALNTETTDESADLQILRRKLMEVNGAAQKARAPSNFSSSGLTSAIDFSFENSAAEVSEHLSSIELNVIFIEEFLEKGILQSELIRG